MDDHRFDALAKSVTAGGTRRELLRGVLAGGLALLMGSRAGSAGAKPGKVTLCHFTGSSTNPYHLITVAAPAVPDHLAHGDTVRIDCCADAECDGGTCCDGQCIDTSSDLSNCGACGVPCLSSEMCMNGECVSRGGDDIQVEPT